MSGQIYEASASCYRCMSDEKKDRFQRIDRSIAKIREELDEAVDDSQELGGKATKEVREAVDNLESKVKSLRKKDKEE